MGKKTALIDKSKKGAEKNTLMYIAICSLNNNLIYIFDGLIIMKNMRIQIFPFALKY